jgi:Domain of unknown function (DUF5666)
MEKSTIYDLPMRIAVGAAASIGASPLPKETFMLDAFFKHLSRRRWLAAFAATVTLAACGGGGDSDSPPPAASASTTYASGTISGLGSIIVGGVRYDDSRARVEDEDGNLRSNRDLKLGMSVQVQASSVNDSNSTAEASMVRFGAELKGPVASIDAAAQTLKILDQTVLVTPQTVFELGLAGFAAIAVSDILEVHAQFDGATGRYTATRIEKEDNANEYRLRGLVSALDAAAKTFKIGDATINYATATEVPAALANGQRVRVRLQTAKVNDQWVATQVRNGMKRVEDHADARVRGAITVFTSATSFEVQGLVIDATNAEVRPNASRLALGAMVDVRGRIVDGKLVASRVQVRGGGDDDEMNKVELHGDISALDTAAKTFVVREVKVDYSAVVEWKDGNEANLANGRRVEVKGSWNTDRSKLMASKIEFE